MSVVETTIDDAAQGLRALLDGAAHAQWSAQDYIVLTSPEDWGIVESGHVDLFAVLRRDGEPQGEWHALGRLGPGDTITGPMSGPRHRVLCRRVDDATLRVHRLHRIRSLVRDSLAPGGDGRAAAALTRGIDSTVRVLSRSLRDGLPPREFTALTEGQTMDLGDNEVARSVDDLVWVDVVAGQVRVGAPGGPVHSGGDHLCLTRLDWISAHGRARVRTASTQSVVASGEIWGRLVAYWTRFLYATDRMAERRLHLVADRIHRAERRDELVENRVRVDNDRFLSSARASPAPTWRHKPNEHLAAVLLVLDHLRADTDVPAEMMHRPDVGDYDALGALGWVRTRPVLFEGAWWNRELGPLAGQWGEDRRPVALLPATGGGYVAHAHWLDAPIRITRQNYHLAGRYGWAVYPALPQHVRTVRSLLRYGVSGLRTEAWLFATMASLVGIAGLITPILNGQILGSFVASASRSMIVQGGFAVILSALVAGAFSVVQNLVVLRMQGAVTARTQTGVWSRLLQLPVTFFDRFSTGRLGTIVLGVKAAQEMLSGVVVAATLGLIVASANLVLIFVYSLPLGLAGLGLTLIAVAVCAAAGRAVVQRERDRYAEDQRLSAMTYETLSAMTKIRGAAAEERAFARWADQQRAVQVKAMRSRKLQDKLTVFNAVYPLLSLLVIYLLAAGLGDSRPSLAALLSFMTAFTLLLTSLLLFTGSILRAAAIVPLIESLSPILAAEPETGMTKAYPGDLSGQVSLRQISFSYGVDGPLVLDDVDIDVHPGEFLAIVGPSGSGKSTIIRLLLGFDRPHAGSILFDGQDLGELDLTAVRRQCGVVLQSSALMPGTVRDNISGGANFTEDEVWEAAEMAGLASDLRAMPMGLATVVDETSHGLSGGQIQRLMIARALVNRPRIVIFDEATSALDNPTQRIVAEATRQLNATRIVVAHRLSTVRGADRVIVMDRGRVVQQGTYEDLIAQPDGLLARLAQRQAS